MKGFNFVPALKAQVFEIPRQSIGELLALDNHGKKRLLQTVHKRRLSQYPVVDSIEHQLRLNGQLDQCRLLCAYGILTT